MKKLLALVLAATLTIGMVVSAAATSTEESVSSPVAETTVVPEVVVDGGEDGNIIIVLTPTEEAEELTEEQQKVFAEAQETLEEAAPDEEMLCIYYWYLRIFVVEDNGEKTPINGPVDAKFEFENDEISKLKDFSELRVMQYVDEEWVELEAVINPDDTITIKDVVEGPIAFFAK